MKVVVVSKSFSKGGSSSGATGLASALDAAGLKVLRCDAYAEQAKRRRAIMRYAERAIERVFFDAETHCIRLGPPTFSLREIYEEHEPDIIQLCDVSGNVIDFSELERVPCPVVHRMSDFWPYHGPAHYASSPKEGSRLAKWLFSKTVYNHGQVPDAVVAPSHWLADTIANPTLKIRVIRNAIPVPSTSGRTLGSAETIRFGFISNKVLDPRKGFLRLRRPLEHLSAGGRSVELNVFGQIRASQKPKLEGVRVVWHGPFGRNELTEVYDSFDILLCPSLLDNSPNVVCEAVAYGRPVIAQSGTGIDSYVAEHFGRLLDFWASPEQLPEFAQACDNIWDGYGAFSTQAVQFAVDALSPVKIGNAYRELYESLV